MRVKGVTCHAWQHQGETLNIRMVDLFLPLPQLGDSRIVLCKTLGCAGFFRTPQIASL
jgi:hypothetical protein